LTSIYEVEGGGMSKAKAIIFTIILMFVFFSSVAFLSKEKLRAEDIGSEVSDEIEFGGPLKEEERLFAEEGIEEIPPEEWMVYPEEEFPDEIEPPFPPQQPYPAVSVEARRMSQPQAKISLDIKGMNILDVLKIISMRSGLNIIAGRNVTGRVTMFLRDVDVMDALEIILAANGLAYEKRGDIINVMTARDYELLYGEKYGNMRQLVNVKLQYANAANLSKVLTNVKSALGKVIVDENSNTLILLDTPEKLKQMQQIIKETDKPIITKVFELQYAVAEDIKNMLLEKLSKNVGAISIDARTNKIAITDYPDKIEELSRIIEEFDERIRQVLIEAKIIQITLDDQFKFGINWDHWIKDKFRVTQSLNTGATAAVFTLGEGADGSSSISAVGDYSSVIDLLDSLGRTEILATPRIIVVNNQEAKILIGEKKSYIETTTSQSGTGTQVTAQSIKSIEGGVKLSVTPTISSDGYITMKIRPEVSSVTLESLTVSGQPTDVPLVNTSEAETTVMVKDGATIIIAGLIKDEATKNRSKIPILGDIPLLGNAFKQISDVDERKELVIFLTPTIVSGREGIKYSGRYETKEMQEMQKSVFEKLAVKEPEESVPEFKNFLEYSNYVSRKISQKAKENARKTSEKGKVTVSFMLLSTGELKKKPEIMFSTNSLLNHLAIKNVEEAAPFPPFYKFSNKREERFRIAISYD